MHRKIKHKIENNGTEEENEKSTKWQTKSKKNGTKKVHNNKIEENMAHSDKIEKIEQKWCKNRLNNGAKLQNRKNCTKRENKKTNISKNKFNKNDTKQQYQIKLHKSTKWYKVAKFLKNYKKLNKRGHNETMSEKKLHKNGVKTEQKMA